LVVPALAIGAVTVANGVATAAPAPARTAAVQTAWTPKQLMEGIFFDLGPVGALLPQSDFPNHTTATAADATAYDQLIAHVDASYPGTSQSVANAIASHNPLTVRTALTTAAHELGALATTSNVQSLLTPNCLALVVVVAVGWLLYLAEFYQVSVDWDGSSAAESSVQIDGFVSNVLTALA
jgi:hypothetical protein